MSTTPLMLLNLPTPSVTIGPDWATQLNDALELVDSHDHSSGKGAKVTTSGLNINADLELNSHNLKEVNSVRMDNQVSALSGVNDVRCIYTVGGELYYNDNYGNQVRLTNAGAIDISTTGGITGDYTTSSADANYSNVSKTFTFDQSSGIRAKIDSSDLIIREAVASANAVTLKSPTSLASSYSLVFPTALPSSTSKFVQISTTGSIESNIDVDNASLEINSNILQIKNSGVTTAKINDLAVTTAKINDLAVTTAKINVSAVTTAKIADANITSAKIASQAVTADKRPHIYVVTFPSVGEVTPVVGNNTLTTATSVDGTTTAAYNGYVLHVSGYLYNDTGFDQQFGANDRFEVYSNTSAAVRATYDVSVATNGLGLLRIPYLSANTTMPIAFSINVTSYIAGSSDSIILRFVRTSVGAVKMQLSAVVVGK